MAANQNPQVFVGGGGFLKVLGIIYLVKIIRQRRRERLERAAAAPPGQG
jgi:hypothetical protein